MAKKWSEEETKRLKELTEAGYIDKDIAKIISDEFGNERTKKAVESKRLDEGFKKIDIDNTEKEKQKKDEEEGTDKIVGSTNKTLNASKQKEGFAIDRLQQIGKEDNWSQKNILALNYLISQGLTNKRISQLIGKTETEIKDKKNELKRKLSNS